MATVLAQEHRRGSTRSTKTQRKTQTKIGDRDVGKGVNTYSLEKDIALGKQLAQEVEREARLVDDPISAKFINRRG